MPQSNISHDIVSLPSIFMRILEEKWENISLLFPGKICQTEHKITIEFPTRNRMKICVTITLRYGR